MRHVRGIAFGAFVAIGMLQSSIVAKADEPGIMMQKCRALAGQKLRMRLPDIETKYEGQRIDGTHAVNGTARAKRSVKAFQCSFNRSGKRIIKFVVNPS